MLRMFALGLLALTFVAGIEVRPVEAARRGNPYSSFNVSGINYGAQRWERQNRSRSNYSRRGGWYSRGR